MRTFAGLLCACACLAPLAAGGQAARPASQADFDGDGRVDSVQSSFSGGAHCCHRISVLLTRSGRRVSLPFLIDGGYVAGEALTDKPERVAIVTLAGQRPVLRLEINTYNGASLPIPRSWTRRYGIRSHRVEVSFAPDGRASMRDVAEPGPNGPEAAP